MASRVKIDEDRLREFCRRWRLLELSLFGSVLRDDFRPDSDVDVLVAFEPGARISLLDHASMTEELSAIFGRRVDLVTRRSVERSRNPLRSRETLSTVEALYVS